MRKRFVILQYSGRHVSRPLIPPPPPSLQSCSLLSSRSLFSNQDTLFRLEPGYHGQGVLRLVVSLDEIERWFLLLIGEEGGLHYSNRRV